MSILHASIISPNSIFVKGEDYFLNPVPPDEQTAEVGVATGCMKGRHGRVWMSPWSLPSARICRSFRGPRALPVPITMPLESTQACFGFWKPCCASVSSPKEHATVTTAQVAVVSHTLAAREGSAEGRTAAPVDSSLSWSAASCPSDCLSHVQVCVRSLPPPGAWYLSYVQFVPQV